MKTWDLIVTVELPDDVHPDTVAERLMNFLAEDPDDLFPEIDSVSTYDHRQGD